MKEIRLASKIVRTLIKDRLHYPGRLIAETLTSIARCAVLLLLYAYVFDLKGGTLAGTTFPIAAWSMFLYFSLGSLRLRDLAKSIPQDIQSGNVEILFSKPVSYLWYKMWWQVGAGLYSFLVLTLIGSIALSLAVGIPSTMLSPFFLTTVLLAFILGSILSLFLYSLVSLASFWIEDASPLFWIVDKTVMILGGAYLPVAFFPPLMYKLAIYSPFGASQFITHTVYETWRDEWFMLMGIQIGWIAIAGLLLFVVFSKAKRSVSVNGG